MGYSDKTTVYALPILRPDLGDRRVSASEDQRWAKTTETQIRGITSASGTTGVISDEGQIIYNAGGLASYRATISAVIDGIHVWAYQASVGLTLGVKNYIYTLLVEEEHVPPYLSSREFGSLLLQANTSGTIPDGGLLIATATPTAGHSNERTGAGVDINPTGKVYAAALFQHETMDTNPHGSTWTQTTASTTLLSGLGVVASSGMGVTATTDTITLPGDVLGSSALANLAVGGNITTGGTTDSVAFSQLALLLGGQNTNLHRHRETQYQAAIPPYPATVVSGVSLASYALQAGASHTYVNYMPLLSGVVEHHIKFQCPLNASLTSVKVYGRSSTSGNPLAVTVLDNNGNAVKTSTIQATHWSSVTLTGLTGSFEPQALFGVRLRSITPSSGIGTCLGEVLVRYD